MRTPNTRLRPTDTLDIAQQDALRLNIADGARVRVTSRYGSLAMTVRVTEMVRAGEVFATFHDPRVQLNKLTSPFRDGIVGAPEYKVTAVNIQKLP